jgi:hypothetical protein
MNVNVTVRVTVHVTVNVTERMTVHVAVCMTVDVTVSVTVDGRLSNRTVSCSRPVAPQRLWCSACLLLLLLLRLRVLRLCMSTTTTTTISSVQVPILRVHCQLAARSSMAARAPEEGRGPPQLVHARQPVLWLRACEAVQRVARWLAARTCCARIAVAHAGYEASTTIATARAVARAIARAVARAVALQRALALVCDAGGSGGLPHPAITRSSSSSL